MITMQLSLLFSRWKRLRKHSVDNLFKKKKNQIFYFLFWNNEPYLSIKNDINIVHYKYIFCNHITEMRISYI